MAFYCRALKDAAINRNLIPGFSPTLAHNSDNDNECLVNFIIRGSISDAPFYCRALKDAAINRNLIPDFSPTLAHNSDNDNECRSELHHSRFDIRCAFLLPRP